MCVFCAFLVAVHLFAVRKRLNLQNAVGNIVGETWIRFVRHQAYFTWHFNNYVPMHIHLTTGTQWKAMPKIIPWIVRCLFYLSSCCHDSFLSLTLHCFSIDMQFLDIKALAWKTFRCWWKENAAIMHDLSSYDRIIIFVCLLHKCLFLEIKGLIMLNVIVWETVAFLFVKGHGSCWEVRDRGAARALRWTQNATNWHVQKRLFLSHSFCLTYIHSLCERQPVSC